MPVELRQLEYFAAVARHRHFTRAAEDLYVTQSALSQQVSRLERELGVALLRRGPRGVDLTPAGAELLERAEAILAEAARARAAMDEHAGLARGVARLALTAVEAPALLEPLAAFHREHPGIQVALRQGSAAEALDLLRTGSVDLAAAGGAGDPGAGVEATALRAEPLHAIAEPGDPLCAGGPVSIGDLRGRRLILAERGAALRDAVMRACAGAGFSPVPSFEVGDPATVRSLVHAGLGASVVPSSWLAQPGAEVAAAPLAGVPPLPLALLGPAAGLPPAAGLLREHLRAALA